VTAKERSIFHLTDKFIRLIGRAFGSAGFYVQNPPAAAKENARAFPHFLDKLPKRDMIQGHVNTGGMTQ